MAIPDLPSRLAARPQDPGTGLPMPWVNCQVDPLTGLEIVDFTALYAPRVEEAARRGLCGLCGQPLEYWIAFIGGPVSASTRTYSDPAMHEECADAAMRVCPHISGAKATRALEHQLPVDVFTPVGFVEDKPQEWILGITRSYRVTTSRATGVMFHAAPWKRTRIYRYRGHRLIEMWEGAS